MNKQMRSRRRLLPMDANGFTLLEVMIAVSIFAIGMIGLMSNQLAGLSGNASAERLTMNSTYASDTVEKFISLDYDDTLVEQLGTTTSDSPDEDQLYSVNVTIQQNTPLTNLKTIDITLNKKAGIGAVAERAITISYIKANVSDY